jgi:Glycosyltransferase family 87
MILKRIGTLALMGFCCGILFFAAGMAARALPVQDLVQYWAAAHVIRQNPYSEAIVTSFERSSGYSMQGPAMVMRNPPSALIFVLPFRYMKYDNAFAAWALVSIFIVLACARASSGLSGIKKQGLTPALLFLLFGPTIALLMLGQIVVLVLLGVTLFLIMAERRRDWLAGASLSLACVKPHVILLFLIAVSLWSMRAKRWVILFSIGLSLLAASAIALLINPHIFIQYLAFAHQFGAETTPYPNLGGMLYIVSGHRELAFLPQFAGLIWTVFYWWHHRSNWNWKSHGMLVLLVSVACSYYSFPFDQVVVLPALIAAYANGNRRIFLGAFVITNLGFALYIFNIAARFGFGYMFLWWTAGAWLVTYGVTLNSRWRPATIAEANVYGP